jgi:hypothetical protein
MDCLKQFLNKNNLDSLLVRLCEQKVCKSTESTQEYLQSIIDLPGTPVPGRHQAFQESSDNLSEVVNKAANQKATHTGACCRRGRPIVF